MPLSLIHRFDLEPWQKEALDKWRTSRHLRHGERHGIAEVFTGAGKTVLAYAAMADASCVVEGLKFAIVAPTASLADQWAKGLPEAFGLSPLEIGRNGGGAKRRDTFATHRFVVYVINSARDRLALDVQRHNVMLVVDECHRAGSGENKKIFEARTVFRLGLSATPQREDLVDEDGCPLPVEEQPHGKGIGPVFYRLTLKHGRELGLLPRFRIHHHRIALTDKEKEIYRKRTDEFTDARSELERYGGDPDKYMAYVSSRVRGATNQQRQAAKKIQIALFRRKSWLYGVSERNRVARLVVASAAHTGAQQGRVIRAMIFNERIGADNGDDALSESQEIGGAEGLLRELRSDLKEGRLRLDPYGVDAIALEHSQLPQRDRVSTVESFRSGEVRILVSVKALVEGIDVPDADVGISVASTSSARQRIQTMGRILRVARDEHGRRLTGRAAHCQPVKELHLIYVGDTVDAQIYAKKNWEEETGKAENQWHFWPLGATQPEIDREPPRAPMSEEAAWEKIKDLPMPQPWEGDTTGVWWTFRQGNISRSKEGPDAVNGGSAIKLLAQAGMRIGRDLRGPFKQTPRLHVLLKDTGEGVFAYGRLEERLTVYSGEPPTDEQLESPVAGSSARPSTDRSTGSNDRLWELQKKEISEEITRHYDGDDAWFDIVKRAFLAERDGDWITKAACMKELGRRKKGRKYGVPWIQGLSTVAKPQSKSVPCCAGSSYYPEIMESAVHAYATGQFNMLRQCHEELSRRSYGNPKHQGLADALGILLGEVVQIKRGGGSAF